LENSPEDIPIFSRRRLGRLSMCWSGEASAVVAAVGYASAALCIRRGESKLIWAPTMYFATMEALQAYTYSVVGQCGAPANEIATTLAYVHICFQPIFINAFSLSFVPDWIRKKVMSAVITIASVAGVLFLLRFMPFDWLTSCIGTRYNLVFCDDCTFPIPLCGEKLCAIQGSWHIGWDMPLKFHPVLDNAYTFGAFLLPLFYGAWRITLYLILAGPVAASFTTDNPNEWPAIWCLFSTLILGLAIQPGLRRWASVQSWYGWRPKAAALDAKDLQKDSDHPPKKKLRAA
jgi:hypothetical protein